MAASIRFDLTRRAQVRNSVSGGLVINRQCIVTDIPIAAGASDPAVLLKCLFVPGFPQLHDDHPDPTFSFCTVDEQVIRGIDSHKSTVDCDIIYKSPALVDPGGGIFFTLTQGYQTSVVQQYSTADGSSNLKIFYLPGAAPTVTSPPTGADVRFVSTHKVIEHDTIRATGVATSGQWDAVKNVIRAIRGTINYNAWGIYDPGTVLFLSPTIRNLDSAGSMLLIQLDFLTDERGFYPVDVYRDSYGNIPSDIASEAQLRALGLPAVGGYKLLNGIARYSTYFENDFNLVFGFAP